MIFTLLISLFMSAPAQAKDECYELLRFPQTERDYHSRDVDNAFTWIEKHMTDQTPLGFNDFLAQNGLSIVTLSESDRKVWLGRYALSEWQRMGSLNHQQRMAALTVELRKLSPGEVQPVQSFNAQADLNNLSARNLERMLKRLDELHPISDADLMRAQRLIVKWDLKFHLLAPHHDLSVNGLNPPLLSPHDFNEMDLTKSDPDFYSDFVGGSMSVGFNLIATNNQFAPFNLGSFVAKASARLKDDFAWENGFYVPEFTNILALMNFLGEWQPEAIEEQLRFMQLSLPSSVKTVKDLRNHLTPDKLGYYFPNKHLYANGAVLRRHLKDFVLNAADGEVFFRTAFRRFLAVASRYHFRISDLDHIWDRPGGAQQIWRGPFMEFLGFDSVAFRVPGSVPPTRYSIVRKEPHPARTPNYTGDYQSPGDSRRLDHNAKP